MTDKIPENMAELLSEIEREWKALWHVVGRLSPEQMTTPDPGGWSPKDNLAHLDEWMHFMQACYLQKKPAHESMHIEEATYATLDEDGVNEVLFRRNRDRSVSDVLEGLKRTYAAALETIRSMPFADLMKPLSSDDPEKRPLIGWVQGNTSAHFAEHRANIEKVL